MEDLRTMQTRWIGAAVTSSPPTSKKLNLLLGLGSVVVEHEKLTDVI